MERPLTVNALKELTKLIEIGGHAGLKSLKFGELELEYINNEKPEIIEEVHNTEQYFSEKGVSLVQNEPVSISDDLKTYESDMILEDEFENLALENPEEYERLLALGKLDEYGSPSAGTGS